MPKFPKAIVWLILSCLTTVIVLYCIQYYLVRNTYQLTKEKYYNALKEAVYSVLMQTEANNMHEEALFSFKKSFYSIYDIKQNKLLTNSIKEKIINDFTKKIDSAGKTNNVIISKKLNQIDILRGINFENSYDTIIVRHTTSKGSKIIFQHNKSIKILGQSIENRDKFNIDKQYARIKDYLSKPPHNASLNEEALIFDIHYSNSIDTSTTGRKIFMRMLGTFLLAAGLILVITILFYIILSSLIKQRKIADIKTDFANNVSHELKTPLASLNIIVKTLSKKAVVENKYMFNETLQALKRQNERLQHITNSILETSVYENNDLILEEIEISSFLNEFLNDVKTSTPSHKIILNLEQKKLKLKLDQVKLQSILNNILENSIKYSPEGSEVEVRSYLQDGFYIISIKDNGIGIAKSNYKQIFEKFYRVTEDKNIHTNKGLGLGLYLSSKNIAELGGVISLESEIGKGSTFFIKFPLNEY